MISEELLLSAVKASLKKINESFESPVDPTQSEKLKQTNVSSKIDDLGIRKKASKKSEGEVDEEAEEEEEESGDIGLVKGDEESEEDKFSYDVPDTFPKNVEFQDIIDQLNFVRSGASAKDDDVKQGLMKYFENLTDDEKMHLLSMLSGFATIMNKAGDVEDAPTPSEIKGKIEKSKKADTGIKKVPVHTAGSSPIVVGEVAKKDNEFLIVKENSQEKHRCTNGQLVPFGSTKSLNDIIRRIDDAKETRDSCSMGSAARSHHNGLLKYLRMQLRAVQKIQK